MDLIAYIREHGVIDETMLTTISNKCAAKKLTFFEELYRNGASYDIKEDDLLKWTIDAGGAGYELLSSTKGFNSNSADYDKLGGVEQCLKLKVMCIRRKGKPLCIVTCRPDDTGLIVMMNKAFGPGMYTIGLCTNSIWNAVYQLDVEPLFIEARAKKLEQESGFTSQRKEQSKESEARAIYNHIIGLGMARKASDIHLIPCEETCLVLYRIDGTNYRLMSIPLSISDRVANILLADGNVANKGPNVPLDGKIRYLAPDARSEAEARDLRFSIMPALKGKDVNIRFLNNSLFTFNELGMTEKNVRAYERILSMPQGLIMQVGPTGSGKSTTLYAGLNYIHENSLRNIITVEDPVEIFMDGITQVSTNDDAKLSFARVSRQFLRHDVDVGVIGEIRDEETALEAVRAATTGHLVISSLHTNDSIGVLERLIRLGVDSYTLSEVLVAVMGQRLVRRLCPHCKEAYTLDPDSERLKEFGIEAPDGKPLTFYRAVGCEHCNNLGYHGRIAVNEILLVDRVLRDMIQRHETRMAMETYLAKTDFQTMFEDAKQKAIEGVTSLEELEPMCSDTLAYKR